MFLVAGHVEQLRNIGIINSTTWLHLVGSFYKIYITMHGSMNIRPHTLSMNCINVCTLQRQDEGKWGLFRFYLSEVSHCLSLRRKFCGFEISMHWETEGSSSGRRWYMQVWYIICLHARVLAVQPSSWRWSIGFETCRRHCKNQNISFTKAHFVGLYYTRISVCGLVSL